MNVAASSATWMIHARGEKRKDSPMLIVLSSEREKPIWQLIAMASSSLDLIGRLAAVRIQRGKKLQILIVIEQADGRGGVAHIDGKQHTKRPFHETLIFSIVT